MKSGKERNCLIKFFEKGNGGKRENILFPREKGWVLKDKLRDWY